MDVLIAYAWFFAPWAAVALLLAAVAPLRLSGLFGVATIVALYTEDAVFVTDTGPLYGRRAIEKRNAEWFKAWHHSNHISKKDPNSFAL